ncbi:MAG: GxxExxY protein [Acidobacteria bacterium]|nr:GxxExxY protein [Acidobacteriota bacterium]
MDCAFAVHRELGPGFREKIYQRALGLELDSRGLTFESEKRIDVKFKEWRIPGQQLDLLVESLVLVEAKVVPKLRPLHRCQVLAVSSGRRAMPKAGVRAVRSKMLTQTS